LLEVDWKAFVLIRWVVSPSSVKRELRLSDSHRISRQQLKFQPLSFALVQLLVALLVLLLVALLQFPIRSVRFCCCTIPVLHCSIPKAHFSNAKTD
jgi:hypothetical protein